jgi:hypothetical protein
VETKASLMKIIENPSKSGSWDTAIVMLKVRSLKNKCF